jgi:hypothetical protein
MQYTVINKHLMAVKGAGSYTSIEPNIFEAVKSECIADARGVLSKFLPYIRIHIPDDLHDLYLWRVALTSDNSPAQVSFKGRADELAAILHNMDFAKPYDDAAANKIRAMFPATVTKKADVDADLIIQGELGELEESK